ncbi:hypothetical protein CKM354_001234700 [Cercospora kikuchii]|uniref:Peptidase A1 domain-containing protein n=1 Tax=Cercospora kikuchii TaxID=84275 RepID=A0A9P3L1M6_9PEZI|nr:uncharacterized protein CKM354_001234700 [Cercospora kikuchii]GIZ49315.1 hypothetical protein CKM354_001234700 [Cercospora kikuchii]
MDIQTMIVDQQRRAAPKWLCVMLATAVVATPVQVPPGSRNYGLDGPWTSLRVFVSRDYEREAYDPNKYDAFDVFPGGWLASILPTVVMCDGNPNCGTGGRFSPNTSIPEDLQTAFVPEVRRANGGGNMDMKGPIRPHSLAIPGPNGANATRNIVPNSGIVALTSGKYVIGENQSNGPPIEVGYLTLGGRGAWGITGVDHWPPGSWLANQSVTTSNSFGLHVGSAALNYSASMYYGGYDRGRTIGPIVEFGRSAAYLQDIVIGVETGGSPFSFNDTKTGLLRNGQGEQSSIPVSFQPIESYLALPRPTCERVAALLPVTYDSTLNLYLWDTEDARYTTIVSSPAYLGFVFSPSVTSSQRVTIKVPFRLLNLTLDPLYSGRTSATPYFPCQPWVPSEQLTSDDDWPTEGTYVLGKSFLQAAFFGRNWENSKGWIVQAPGPGVMRNGLAEDIRDINRDDTTIDTNSDLGLFASSWSDHWTPLGNSTSNDGSNTDDNDAGLSTGAKAGIGAAVGIAALAAISVALFFIRRRQPASRSQRSQETRDVQDIQILDSGHKGIDYYPIAAVEAPSWTTGPRELAAHSERQELAGQSRRQELA